MFSSLTGEQQTKLTGMLEIVIDNYRQGMDDAEDRLLADADSEVMNLVEAWGYDVVIGALDDHILTFYPRRTKLSEIVDNNQTLGQCNIDGSTHVEVLAKAEQLMPEAKLDGAGNVYFFMTEAKLDGTGNAYLFDSEEDPDIGPPVFALPPADGKCRKCGNQLDADGKCRFINHN